MAKRIPQLNSLKVFEAAARHLSFKRAADELHVTPAAVSHQLSQLESFLGVRLFNRLSQGIQLTPAARLCLPKLQEGLRCLQEAVDQIRVNGDTKVLSVLCTASLTTGWLMPRLHRFVLDHPGLDVQVHTHIGPLAGRRRAGRGGSPVDVTPSADLVLTYGDGDYPGRDVERLLDVHITPMCSPRLMEENPLRHPDDLSRHILLHDDRETLYGNKSFWTTWLEHAGHAGAEGFGDAHFTHAHLAISAAADGMGVVTSTPIIAAAQLEAGKLAAPFDLQVKVDSAYYVFTNPECQREDIEAFRAWLRAEAAATMVCFPEQGK